MSGSGLKNEFVTVLSISIVYSLCTRSYTRYINGVVGHQFGHGIHVQVGIGPPQVIQGPDLDKVDPGRIYSYVYVGILLYKYNT